MNGTHLWKFFRAGGFDQVRLETGADLLALDELDQKLWVALACPTTGLEFDAKTLAMIDADKDGRIRAPELMAAVNWAAGCLKNPDDLFKGSAELPLNAINDSSAEGKQLLASARGILNNLGKRDALAITLDDTLDTEKIFAQTCFNGDGIVPADSAEDEAIRALINEIIACCGAIPDRSGKPGVDQTRVDLFFAEAQAYSDWWIKSESDRSILPLGPSTPAAFASFQAVKAKLEDYFTRCRLAAFDPRALTALNREEKEYLAFSAKDLTLASVEIAGFPLAQIAANKPLPLDESLNPAWSAAMAKFTADVVRPILPGNCTISQEEWRLVKERFASHEAWVAAKAGSKVEPLGAQRVREILAGPGREAINVLIAEDKALEGEAGAIAAVEKLVRYYRDLHKLLNNFVSFRDFYSRKDKAIFQAGTLFLDQRSCDLCIAVSDPAKHATMAVLSGTYLVYCDCVRKGAGEQLQIVAAFTDGDSDNLMVGRNGVFYDRKGRDWDATIAKIVDNPISIRQAFWAPYKKAARMIQEQIAKRAAVADEAAVANLAQTAQQIEAAVAKGSAPPAPAAAAKQIDPGLVAALGVGAAGLGGMIGGVVSGFLGLKWLMPLGVLGIMLMISGPSMIIAWLKLHKRNLGPILDANGWAVNAKARINVPFGASLTSVAALPQGAQRDLVDVFAEKKRPWKFYCILIGGILLALLYWHGTLDGSLPHRLKSTKVLGEFSPRYVPPPVSTNAPPTLSTNAPAPGPQAEQRK
jgi:hypothetical protein